MVGITDLPDELLSEVIMNLGACGLSNVNLICRRFHNAAKSDQIWKCFCWRDYKVNEDHLWPDWTYYEFYTKVLFKYSHLFGLWQRDLSPYGGIIFVKLEKCGIVGYELLPPYDSSFRSVGAVIRHVQIIEGADYSESTFYQLRFKFLFILKMVREPNTVICYHSFPTAMPGQYGEDESREPLASFQSSPTTTTTAADGPIALWETTVPKVSLSDAGGMMRQAELHLPGKVASASVFCIRLEARLPLYDMNYCFERHFGFRGDDVLAVQNILAPVGSLALSKIFDLEFFKGTQQFRQLPIQRIAPETVRDPCIKPGLYNGWYGEHGWEIINFSYCGRTLEGKKVTGDPNVPAGKITVRVFLDRPVILTADEQSSLEEMKSLFAERYNTATEAPADFPAVQPFRIPVGCTLDGDVGEIPKTCRWRYLAEGYVAGHDYTDPETTLCLFSAFRDDYFSILWLEQDSLFFYQRCNTVDGLF